MSALKKLYGEIAKVEDQDDGTIKVWGIASSAAEDADGETITADAMKASLPDYMKFGAVREMHQPSAAGTALKTEVLENGTTEICAHIVDTEAVKKVKTGVYKGFSVGGRVTGRDELNKSIITGIKLVEISLVDRPANPAAVITMYKSELLEPVQGWFCGNLEHQHIAKADALKCIECGGVEIVEKSDDPATTGGNSTENTTTTKSTDADKRAVADRGESQKAESADDLKKGMWSVQDFAGALRSLAYICSDAEYESQYEGDASPVPAQLRAWLAQGVEIFKAMAAEELSEMLADLKEQAGEMEVVQMAAAAFPLKRDYGIDLISKMKGEAVIALASGEGFDIEKAGARNSKSDLEKIQTMHDHTVALGADCGTAKADGVDDLTKAELTDDDLQKHADAWFAKFAKGLGVDDPIPFTDYITKVNDELGKRATRIAELEAMPAPIKGALRVVSKADDLGGGNANKEEPIRKADGSVDDLATEMRAALRTPETVNRLR